MTVSLAHGGAGLGTAFGEQVARKLLADAGFVDLEVHEAPGDPIDAVYVARRLELAVGASALPYIWPRARPAARGVPPSGPPALVVPNPASLFWEVVMAARHLLVAAEAEPGKSKKASALPLPMSEEGWVDPS